LTAIFGKHIDFPNHDPGLGGGIGRRKGLKIQCGRLINQLLSHCCTDFVRFLSGLGDGHGAVIDRLGRLP
jgi:hypothetical protein